jgi:hypothetical protein
MGMKGERATVSVFCRSQIDRKTVPEFGFILKSTTKWLVAEWILVAAKEVSDGSRLYMLPRFVRKMSFWTCFVWTIFTGHSPGRSRRMVSNEWSAGWKTWMQSGSS